MKMNITKLMGSKKGMTLLELTVVILVLLTLISILFIGARAWKRGADRSGCILNIRNVQQAMRGYQNMHPEKTGCTTADLYSDDGTTGYLKTPKCPGGGAYTAIDMTTFPDTGTLAISCSLASTLEHVPGEYSQW